MNKFEEYYLSPDERERMEIGLDRTSEILDLIEAEMENRNMFDEYSQLKAQFSSFLAFI